MIRDPSDGTVREKIELDQGEATGTAAPAPGLFDEVKANIAAGKVKPERVSTEWAYQRAWNDGIDFALREICKIEKASLSTPSRSASPEE